MKTEFKIGAKFGKLTVKNYVCSEKGKTKYECVCDCGNKIIVKKNSLVTGNTKSCGCYKKEVISKSNTTHGLTNHKLYWVWISIKERCYNKNNINYENYGLKNKIMCEEWKNNFLSFYNWSIKNGYKEGLQIDRINNDGNYEPDNCQFITQADNLAIGKQGKRKDNTTGYVGVSHDSKIKKYKAYIYINKKQIYLGCFENIEDAVLARKNKEIDEFGEQKTNKGI